MTARRGLPEMFVGYDTGHDNSGRLEGIAHPGNNHGKNAAELPDDDGISPIIAVDISCNYFATLTAISEMAEILDDQNRLFITEIKPKKQRKRFLIIATMKMKVSFTIRTETAT